jgi:hypothetical protein
MEPANPSASFEPVLPIAYRDRKRWVTTRRMVMLLFAFAVIGISFAWWVSHRHILASFSISLAGGSARWDPSEGRWKHGGETSVDFSRTALSLKDESLARLDELHRVVSLNLNHCERITPKGMAVLRRLPHLRILSLSRSSQNPYAAPVRWDDAIIDFISGLPELEELSLDGIPITDEGLARLRKLPKLESLDVSDTKITDKGLSALRQLPSLKRIFVGGTKVTQEGVGAYVKDRPEAEIFLQNPAEKIRTQQAY